MILALALFLILLGVVSGIVWGGRVLRRHTTRRWPLAVCSGVLFGLGLSSVGVSVHLATPNTPHGSHSSTTLAASVVVLCLIPAFICLAALFDERPTPSAADGWATAHGVRATPRNSDFIVAYVFEGHRLRLVCGIGGFVVAASLSAGTGVDLNASGWVWLLAGYLVGVVWSQAWLTRLPSGTRRVASLSPRRISDYLTTAMFSAQFVVAVIALAPAGLALAQSSAPRLTPGLAAQFAGASAESLRHLTIGMAVAAFLLVVGVGLLQRHIVGKSQPMDDPDLLAADDAVRASAVHLLSGTAIAIVLLLVATQLRMLAATGAISEGLGTLGAALGFLGALVAWRFFGHRSWVVRRRDGSALGTALLEGTWS
jgi:protein-S-isoprenylcysteine O-methyltransferase Ste14